MKNVSPGIINLIAFLVLFVPVHIVLYSNDATGWYFLTAPLAALLFAAIVCRNEIGSRTHVIVSIAWTLLAVVFFGAIHLWG